MVQTEEEEKKEEPQSTEKARLMFETLKGAIPQSFYFSFEAIELAPHLYGQTKVKVKVWLN